MISNPRAVLGSIVIDSLSIVKDMCIAKSRIFVLPIDFSVLLWTMTWSQYNTFESFVVVIFVNFSELKLYCFQQIRLSMQAKADRSTQWALAQVIPSSRRSLEGMHLNCLRNTKFGTLHALHTWQHVFAATHAIFGPTPLPSLCTTPTMVYAADAHHLSKR
jgi:hypothetical protein